MQRRFTCIAGLAIVALFVQILPMPALASDVMEESGLQAAREAKTKSVVQNAFAQNKKVSVTLDGNRNYVGKISGTSETGFTLADAKTGETRQLNYSEVNEVRRKGMSRGAKIALGIGIGFGVGAAASVIAFKPWRTE